MKAMTINELKANIIMHNQQIKDINRSLAKLDERQCADETAVRILTDARWRLSQERNAMNVQLGFTTQEVSQ